MFLHNFVREPILLGFDNAVGYVNKLYIIEKFNTNTITLFGRLEQDSYEVH